MTIIEQLIANEKPFGLMSAEMQNRMIAIGKASLDMFLAFAGGTWHEPEMTNRVFCATDTYRLRSDYTEEPEIEEWPIFKKEDNFKYKRDFADGGDVGSYLDCAFREINFIGFKFEDGGVSVVPIVYRTPSGTVCDCPADEIAKQQILHATHVLFRRQK